MKKRGPSTIKAVLGTATPTKLCILQMDRNILPRTNWICTWLYVTKEDMEKIPRSSADPPSSWPCLPYPPQVGEWCRLTKCPKPSPPKKERKKERKTERKKERKKETKKQRDKTKQNTSKHNNKTKPKPTKETNNDTIQRKKGKQNMKTHHIAMASWWPHSIQLQSNCFSPPPKLLWASTSLRLRSQPCSLRRHPGGAALRVA